MGKCLKIEKVISGCIKARKPQLIARKRNQDQIVIQ